MQTKVSVIVPVYNVERYLGQCLDSLIGQTLSDIEIILVNDGSNDGSALIAESYANNDQRVRVIHTEQNKGVSHARNIGLSLAVGEYVTFIDSDDWVGSNMLEQMYSFASNSDVEVVVAGIVYNYRSHTIYNMPLEQTLACDNKTIGDVVHLLNTQGLFNVVWNKLYKTQLIRCEEFVFDERLRTGEDLIFNVDFFKSVSRVGLMSHSYYNYMKRDEATLVNTYHPDLHDINKQKYGALVDLYHHYCLTSQSQVNWLLNSYIYGLMDFLLNLYRRECPFSSRQKVCIIRQFILDDKQFKESITGFLPVDVFGKIFKGLCLLNNATILQSSYHIMFWCKNNFGKLYKRFRYIFYIRQMWSQQ